MTTLTPAKRLQQRNGRAPSLTAIISILQEHECRICDLEATVEALEAVLKKVGARLKQLEAKYSSSSPE